ncbi:hypothetical protein ACFSYD_02240 [Paracoccus aerius]
MRDRSPGLGRGRALHRQPLLGGDLGAAGLYLAFELFLRRKPD